MTAPDFPAGSPVSTLLARLEAVKQAGGGWIARCPAHTDTRPSLKIDTGDDGRALLHCYAGCEPAAIVAAIGLTMADTFARDSPPVRPPASYATSERITYDYRDASGAVVFQEVRDPPKRFWMRCPDGRGGWSKGLDGVARVLWNLPELIARRDEPVFLTEGAKDAERLRSLGLLATTTANGAAARWLDGYSETLKGRDVAILADNDPAGINCAQKRAEALHGIASRVRIVLLPDLPAKGDVSDWLDAGHTKAELIHIVESAPNWPPDDDVPDYDAAAVAFGPAIITADALMAKEFPPPRWAVEGLFAEGLSIFAGPPKIGKSWLCLNVAVAVTLGGVAIGKIPVDGGDVLYLAMEDTERRLQERLAITLRGDAPPPRLHIATEWPALADGAATHLRQWLTEHPDARLVIIDTFQKLRGAVPGNQNLYAADYDSASQLKRVADAHGVALVMVHHTRKALADDPLDAVSGSNGLAGAADSTLVLRKEIGRADGTLYIRGRDVPEADHALTFDPDACSWTLLGDAATHRMSEERAAIITVLSESSEPMSPKHIAEALGKKDGAIRYLLHKLAKSGDIDGIGGAYRLPIPANTPNALTLVPETTPEALVVTSPTANARTKKPPPPTGAVSGVRGVRGTPDDQRAHRIWCCAGCHLPRSRGPEPCPGCGATAGRWIDPEVAA